MIHLRKNCCTRDSKQRQSWRTRVLFLETGNWSQVPRMFTHGKYKKDCKYTIIKINIYYTERTPEILDHEILRWFYISAIHDFWAWVSRFRGNKPRPFVARHVILLHSTRRFSAKNVWNDLKCLRLSSVDTVKCCWIFLLRHGTCHGRWYGGLNFLFFKFWVIKARWKRFPILKVVVW